MAGSRKAGSRKTEGAARPAGRGEEPEVIEVGGHEVRVTHPEKVMYPESGTTKRDVVDYYTAVAEVMLPHVRDRPTTRKRWVRGVDGPLFFEKNLGAGAPAWVRRQEIEHKDHTNTYPVVDDAATLVWLAQSDALEIHVPQWRFGVGDARLAPDRMVLDLDPGPGAGLPECVEVALLLRELLTGMGLEPFPVTSGSKGIHLYAPLDGRQTSDQVSAVAHELARALESDHPDLVVSDMKKALRSGKVLVDWSQNNAAKTTVAPYSLRGRARPWVAAPRTWRELTHPGLAQLEWREVLRRVRRRGDPMAGASDGAGSGSTSSGAERSSASAPGDEDPDPGGSRVRAPRDAAHDTPGGAPRDSLDVYRSKRDPRRTPEPVPQPGESSPEAGAGRGGRGGAARDGGAGGSFVIHEHHARRLHWDFRLARGGALVSWALPKGEPADTQHNHLAVQTEDHPLAYGSFEGTIPRGEYGAGEVTIWDEGTYDTEKWSDHEVIVVLHGARHGVRRLALIRTHLGRGGEGADGGGGGGSHGHGDGSHGAPTGAGPVGSQWLIHRMALEHEHGPGTPAAPSDGRKRARRPDGYRPMLATLGERSDVARRGEEDEWAFEMKWDGIRALARVERGAATLTSRNGIDLTATYPEVVAELPRAVRGDAVLDGELVALQDGVPSFARLQRRMNLTSAAAVARARSAVPVELYLFDVLEEAGEPVVDQPYDHRRERLQDLVADSPSVKAPPAFDGDLQAAWETSERLRLEGVVAKRRGSRYRPGARSEDWVKVKHRPASEVVVVGWRPGRGRLTGGLGSVLLGVRRDDGLVYAGRVGTGFSEDEREAVLSRLRRLRRRTPAVTGVPAADAADAVWVTPSQVAEVELAGWTGSGRVRQARWRGWRPDKDAAQVVAEAAGS